MLAASCGGSDDDGSAAPDATSTTAPTTTAATTTSEAVAGDGEPLRILVTNDDSYEAEGIDALVEGLLTLDAIEVEVVAPLDEQSGQGGRSTVGDLEVTDVELASGYEARAVDGFPADSVRVAVDELGIEPDLVVSGINSGQNLGPLVDVSGTVGAARAAVARDIPALATCQGIGDDFDYDEAVPLIVAWVEDRRDDLASGDAPSRWPT